MNFKLFLELSFPYFLKLDGIYEYSKCLIISS